MNASPVVGVVMGSKSDYEVLLPCLDLLREFAIPHEARIVSAHRTPDWLFQYAEQAEPRGLKIIIAAAGGAAHLPGMLAAKTIVPVLAVPVPSTCLQGIDSLLSIVQMPKGIPVATLAIGKPGAANAALLAVAILAGHDPELGSRLRSWRQARSAGSAGHGVAGLSAIVQGSTIGILGGGQLGRMTAMAARSLGYRVQVMDPDPSCPARFVVDACFVGSWDDAKAAADLARGCDVITLEIEQISIASLEAADRHAPVRPGKEILAMVQDRIRQKNWLRDQGFPVGPYRAVYSEADLADAMAELGNRIFLKRAQGGYDGRGQVKLEGKATGAGAAWRALGEQPCVAEQAFDLQLEISVMVARNPSGQVVAYPAATNHHEQQILVWSALPSSIPAALENPGAGVRDQHGAAAEAGGLAGGGDVRDRGEDCL